MGLFFKKKEKKEENNRSQLLDENASVPFTTEIADDVFESHLAFVYKNVPCPLSADVSELQKGAVLYMKEDGLIGNCCGEMVAKLEDKSILSKVKGFFSSDEFCTIRTKFVSASESTLLCNIGFYKDGSPRKTTFVSVIDKNPLLENKWKEELDGIDEVYVETDSSCTLQEQKLSAMPEIKLVNITKSFVLDAKLPSFVVVDVETTGLNVRKDKIIQLSAIRFENRMPVESFNSLVNPNMHIDEEASEINGIYDEDVESAPSLSEIAKCFEEFVGKSPIVGYNIPFDLSVLFCAGIDIVSKRKIYDAMVLAKKIYRNELEHFALKDVLDLNGFNVEGLHDSKVDSFMTGKVFLKMIDQITQQ